MSVIDNTLKGVVPCYSAMKAGMERAQRQKQPSKKKKKHTRLTELDNASEKPMLCKGVAVSQAVKKLYDYEETGLAPYEIHMLIEREKALTAQVKKMQDW